MDEIASLTEILQDTSQSSYKRRDAFAKITRLSPPDIVEILAPMLADDDRYLRQDIVRFLSDQRDSKVIPALAAALDDEDETIITQAVTALGRIGDPQAMPRLLPLLEHRSYSIRMAAEEAVRLLGGIPEPVDDPAPEPEPVEDPAPEPEPVEDPAPEPELELDAAAATGGAVTEEANQPLVPEEPSVPEPQPETEPEPEAAVVESSVAEEDAQPVAEEPPPIPEEPPPIPEPGEAGELLAAFEELGDLGVPPKCAEVMARLKMFFGADFEKARLLYKAYWHALGKLPAVEPAAHSASKPPPLPPGQKEKAIAAIDKEIKALSRVVQSVNGEIAELEYQEYLLREKMNSAISSVLGVFLPSAQTDLSLRHRRILDELHSLRKTLDRDNSRMAKLRNNRRKISGEKASGKKKKKKKKGKHLKTQSEPKTSSFESNLCEADEGVDSLIRQRLIALSISEFSALVEKTFGENTNNEMLCRCRADFDDELAQLATHSQLVDQAQLAFSTAEVACKEQTQKIAEVIADSLGVETVEQELKLRVRCELEFNDVEDGPGQGNADGVALGEGVVSGKYATQRLDWQQSEELTQAVENYSKAWRELGRSSARVETVDAMHRAAENAIHDFVRIIRRELERESAGENG